MRMGHYCGCAAAVLRLHPKWSVMISPEARLSTRDMCACRSRRARMSDAKIYSPCVLNLFCFLSWIRVLKVCAMAYNLKRGSTRILIVTTFRGTLLSAALNRDPGEVVWASWTSTAYKKRICCIVHMEFSHFRPGVQKILTLSISY